ncbi:DoxX family protein [Nocardia vinacea]|uniref:DoxX family protein n=1 Tax=Nocardia vinacea TaxID=96468 RepID=A0ABZ1YTQ6_9NOCA|nr:DoxX family protein [Nocardia vinacea]
MNSVDGAALVIRLVVGLTMAAHGYNHLFGGGGVAGTTRWFAGLGMRPARVHAVLSGVGELAAGLALAVGFCTLPAAAFVIGTMVVAGVTAHRRNGFFVFKDGFEYVLSIAVVCAAVALLGPGQVSVDHLLARSGDTGGGPAALAVVLAGLGGAIVLLAACWRPNRA